MEKLVSTWINVQTPPENYIFPPETRPGNLKIPVSNSIPVIDLSEAEEGDRILTIQKILKACREFGFFQVINHGVSEDMMNETRGVVKEFFQLPAEYKQNLYTEDTSKKFGLYTSSSNFATEKVHLWRDCLRHPCLPLEQWQQFWPENPTSYREYVGACSVEVKNLASRILRLISDGLGLKSGYFDTDVSGCMFMSANHYPPCPEPSLTLGFTKHADPNLITILLQDDIYGLQVFKDDEWIGVEPLPDAFVVNIGHQLEIITNGKLKSADHRVVTNASDARTSVAFFVNPSEDSIIEPEKALIDEFHSPIYKSFEYKEFLKHYFANNGDRELLLESFKA